MDIHIDRLFTYIITHDSGFAPNPFHGSLTLACCKPKMRKSIGKILEKHPSSNIWIMAISPKEKGLGNKVVAIMKIGEVMTFTQYWEQHPEKRPDFTAGKLEDTRGDNIYQPLPNGGFMQIRSRHSTRYYDDANWEENAKTKKKDLSGEYVLLSNEFIYFGSKPIDLPRGLHSIIPLRGHRCNFPRALIEKASELVYSLNEQIQKKSIIALPKTWMEEENK